MRLRMPSAATILAGMALVIALGGSAVAASHYLITSTKQIRPSVLRQLRGKAGANGVSGLRGPAGAAGPTGAAGPGGPQGPAGPTNLSTLNTVTGPTVEVPPASVKGASAVCPAGSRAVSGGGFASIAGIDASEASGSGREGWFIIIDNETGIVLKINAEVLCAGAGNAVAASAPRARRADVEQRMQEDVARITAEREEADQAPS